MSGSQMYLGGSTQFAAGYPDKAHLKQCFEETGLVIENLHCRQVYSQIAARPASERLLPDIKSCNVPRRFHIVGGKANIRQLTINGKLQYDTMDSCTIEFKLGNSIYTASKRDELEWLEVCMTPSLQAAFEKEREITISEYIDGQMHCFIGAQASACTQGNNAATGGIDFGTIANPIGLTRHAPTSANPLPANIQYVLDYMDNGREGFAYANNGGRKIAVVVPSWVQFMAAKSDHATNAQLAGETYSSSYFGSTMCDMMSGKCGVEVYPTNCVRPVGKTASGKPIYEVQWIIKEDFDMAQGKIKEWKGVSGLPINMGLYSGTVMRFGGAVARNVSVAKGYIYKAD